MNIARLKFPAPATGESWVISQHADPVFYGGRRAAGPVAARQAAGPV